MLCCARHANQRLPIACVPQLNDDYYECLTPASTIALLEACKQGNPPKMGRWGSLPMNGQVGLVLLANILWCHTVARRTDRKTNSTALKAMLAILCLFA